ncbi:gfo/Idh/MocA family oxidoreductase, partial [Enterobacter hormaechei]
LHLITCEQNQTVPETSGEQSIMAQRIVERLCREAMSE